MSYIGGLTVLLTFNASQMAKDFFYSKKGLLQKWFSSSEIWNGQEILPGRIAKIKIHGVPLHLWDKTVFDKVAASLGKILIGADSNYLNTDLTSCQATILVTSHKRVACETLILHGNSSYVIAITEIETLKCPFDAVTGPENSSENSSGGGSPVRMECEQSDHVEKETTSEPQSPTEVNARVSADKNISVGPSPMSPVHSTKTTPPPHVDFNADKNNNVAPTPKSLMQSTRITPPSHANKTNYVNNANPTPSQFFSENNPNPPTSPPPSQPQPSPEPNPNLTKSRKRQRRFSPKNLEAPHLDLNSPPPSFRLQNHLPMDYNTAPAAMNKHSDFTSRYNLAPIPFVTLFNQDEPNPNQLDTTVPKNLPLNQPQPNPIPLNQNISHPNPPPPPPPPIPSYSLHPNSPNPNTSPPPQPLDEDVRDTILIGECIGIHLDNHVNEVTELASLTRVNNGSQ